MPQVGWSDHSIGVAAGRKRPDFTMISAFIRPTHAGRAARMTNHKTADVDEYELQVRNLVRLVSVCTLGLWSFAAGLLIGSFYLF